MRDADNRVGTDNHLANAPNTTYQGIVMNELNLQVKRAQFRLNLFRFIYRLAWCCFASLLVAAVAIVVPKIWAMNVNAEAWFWGWVGGALVVGLGGAALWTYLSRFSSLDAAIEIDQRFGLKERISSTLALNEQEQETEIGKALVSDAVRRVERIDITEKFQFNGRWWNLLPLAPAILVFAMMFFPNAKDPTKQANATSVTAKQTIEKSTQELKKRVAKLREKAKAEGKDLKIATEALKQIEKGVEDLTKADGTNDKKKAMVKLNNLADEIRKRRQEMGDKESLQKQLNQLGNMKQGPADRLTRAMKDADFGKAMDEISKLQQDMKDGKLSKEQQDNLAKQMNQMADKLQQMAAAHEQAKQDLQQKIDQAKRNGDRAKAGELQKKLDKMQNQQKQMDKLNQMAQNMQKAAQAMQNGQKKQAQQQMDQLAQNLQEMQENMEELEMMNDALDEIAQAKDAMNCEACQGGGCEACMGEGEDGGMGFGEGEMPGDGMGEGEGVGDRPEAETDTSTYESKVKGKIRKGRAVVTGTANGQNVAGRSSEDIKELLSVEDAEDADPLSDQQIPRNLKDHARQYLETIGNQK